MNPTREESLFAAALEQPPSERAAFLNGACLGDSALHQRVEALLAAHEATANPLHTAATLKVEFVEESADEAMGQILGRYKLLERVGEGGCGVVYVAEQTEPVRRRVALKVIKLGIDTKQVVARFEAERQALAMMDHPNIAKVLDAGTTGLGRPYFVMELVRGIKITDYCDQANLSTKDRLDLFIKVCQAIQHAHQKGIIHRDIKPSNILVTLHDGVPVPKVIDFGIAKATEGRLTDATVYTQLHQFIGTPVYMSPEQAEMSGLDIDTRSDIYSLGVLLYELLAGSTPFDAKELMAQGIDAMRRTIREKEPQRPSTKLSQTLVAADVRRLQSPSSDKPATEEEVRASSRRLLRVKETIHQLKGDLDWIVMKCLEKDRQRRYETANGLAADLKRHLNNEPVVARPPSTAYKFQKAWRRNRFAYGAGAAVTLAILIGFTVSTRLYLQSNRLVRELRAERIDRYFDEAMSAALSGDPDRMAQAIKRAEDVGVQDYRILLVRGWHDYSAGKAGDAIRHLVAARKLKPDNVAVLSLLALANSVEQQWSEYEQGYVRITKLEASTPEDHLFKGSAVAVDDPDRGLALIDEAIRLRSSPVARLIRAEARATRANYALRTNDVVLAVQDLEAARSVLPDRLGVAYTGAFVYATAAMVFKHAGMLEEARRFTKAADHAAARLAELSDTPAVLTQQALVLEMTGREDEQFRFLEDLVERKQQRHPLLLTRYAIGLCVRGRFTQALELLDPVVPNDSFLDGVRMAALMAVPQRRGEFDQAFRAYLERYHGIGDQLYGLWLPWFAGRPEQALALGRRFHENPPAGFELRRPEFPRASRYLAGLLSHEDYLTASHGTLGEFWDAPFLVGMRKLGEGERAAAQQHLQGVVRAPAVWMYTYEFARVVLAIIEREPNWPPPAKERP